MLPASRLCLVSGLALLPGCVTTSSPSAIQGSQSGVFLPAVRVSVGGAGAEPPSHPKSGHALELGATSARWSDRQAIGAGEQPVSFGGQAFAAPAEVAYDFEFGYLEASYRGRWFVNEAVGIELAAGLAYASLDLDAASGGRRASESLGSLGASLGAGLLLRLRPGTSVQSRYTYYEAPTIDSVSRVQRFELGLAQALGANAGVRAGYGTWLIESERGVGLSSIKARFSGPALALELMF
jgi:hypothetical protein